jgi:hypothetical protein
VVIAVVSFCFVLFCLKGGFTCLFVLLESGSVWYAAEDWAGGATLSLRDQNTCIMMMRPQDFKADVVLHFGMHGTVEWLPGAPLGNTGLSWSDVLLG